MQDENYIISQFEINDESFRYKRIINSYEYEKETDEQITEWDSLDVKPNYAQISKCEIFINNEKIPFDYYYLFPNTGIYTIKYKFNTIINSTSFMFARCESMVSIDFTHFNSSKIEYVMYMFFWCSSLRSINFGDFNTEKVTDMNDMFDGCFALKSIEVNNNNFNKFKNIIGENLLKLK